MKVRILTNLGSQDYPDCPYLEGETHNVGEALAAKLIANRHAVKIDEPKPEPAPVIAKLETPEPTAPKAVAPTAKTKTPK